MKNSTPADRVYARVVLTTAIITAVQDAIAAGMTAADIASVLHHERVMLQKLAELLESED